MIIIHSPCTSVYISGNVVETISLVMPVWNKKMVHTQFNWYWYHVPTYAPYKVEGMFFPLILAHSGSAQSVKTASIVLQSLTPNAQNVFKVLAEHQLAHPDEEGKWISLSLFEILHLACNCIANLLLFSSRNAIEQLVHSMPRAISGE